MMGDQTITLQGNESSASSSKEIGNIIVCLYYLSSQAKTLGIKDLTSAIDKAIADITDIGIASYKKNAGIPEQNADTQDAYDRQNFIFDFCHIEDHSAHLELQNIIQRIR